MLNRCKQWETLFYWAPKSLQMVTAAMKLKDACSLEEKLWQTCPPVSLIPGIFQARVLEWGAIAFSDDKLRQCIKKQRHCFADKGLYNQS